MRNVVLILVVLASSSIGARAQQPNAREILARVASVYATCQRYYDEGTINAASQSSRNYSFRTTFERPGNFAFELWRGENENARDQEWVVWKNGEAVKSSAPSNLTFDLGDAPLDVSLMRLASQSSGSSMMIPSLLDPSRFRTADAFSLVQDWKVTGEELIDGRKTFLIEGTLLGRPVKLWIDKTQYLILRVVRQHITVNYKPKLNADVSDENLAFKPPMDKARPTAKGGVEILSAEKLPVTPPVLRPRLRTFGSTLSRLPGQKTIRTDENSGTGIDVVRVDTDLVVSDVLVLNPEGRIVSGLAKEDFIVKEDSNLQQVASFSLGDSKDIPRSIVLIIDYSGSQLPYIKTSVEAAKMLVDKLNPKDRMALVTDDVKLLVGFTSDKNLLKAELESLKTRALSGEIGTSYQYDALMATLNELFDNEDMRSIVIFQTDGDQLDSLKDQRLTNQFALPRKYSLQDIINEAERARVTVYSVISGVKFAGVPEEEIVQRARADWENRQNANNEIRRARNLPLVPSNAIVRTDGWLRGYAGSWLRTQMALAGVSKLTGAWAEFLEQPSQADEIYTRILKNIELRYVIGYYPSNRARDGKRRKVQIEVRNHPEYVVVGQRSYFAREEK